MSSERPTKRVKKATAQTSLSSFFTTTKAKKPSTITPIKEGDQKAAKSDPVEKPVDGSKKKKAASPTIDAKSTEPIIPKQVPPAPTAVWREYQKACLYRKVSAKRNDVVRNKVAAFDLDGTLLVWRIDGWPSRFDHYELWNPKVVTKLRQLYDEENYRLVIFSNQGAIRQAFQGKKATMVKAILEWLARLIDRPLTVVMSTSKKNGYHKPSPNMWKVAETCCFGFDFEADIAGSFFVGDSIGGPDDPQGGVDVGFAKSVGEEKGTPLKFYAPPDFFGPSSKSIRERQQQHGDASAFQPPSPETLEARAALSSGTLPGPLMIILCGAQGSGKSTFCARLTGNSEDASSNNSHWVTLSQDTIQGGKPGKREAVEARAEQILQEKQQSVVIDRMHLDASQREYFVQLAQKYQVPVHAVVLMPTKDVLAQRVRNRTNHPGGVQGESGVTIATRSASRLVRPTHQEGFQLISVAHSSAGAERLVELYRRVGTSTRSAIPRTITLADTKVKLPTVCLGTMKVGKKVAADIVSQARALGIRGVDTAPTYQNEDRLALPDDSFCIIKVPKRASTAEEVKREIQQSLSKLGRSKADLVLLHWPADTVETTRTIWAAMEDCCGSTSALGVCNFGPRALTDLLAHCRIPPCVNQVERHPLLPQWDLVDFCAQHDLVLQAHTALGQGRPELLQDEPSVQNVVASTGLSAAQVVLLWNVQQGVAVVPKSQSSGHLTEIADVLTTRKEQVLLGDDMKELNGIQSRKRFVNPPFWKNG